MVGADAVVTAEKVRVEHWKSAVRRVWVVDVSHRSARMVSVEMVVVVWVCGGVCRFCACWEYHLRCV